MTQTMGKGLKGIRRPNRRESTLRGNLRMDLLPARLTQRESWGPSNVVSVLPAQPRGLCRSLSPSFCPRRCRLRPPSRAEDSPQPWERASVTALRKWQALHPCVAVSCLPFLPYFHLELAHITVRGSHIFCSILLFVRLLSVCPHWNVNFMSTGV